MGNLFVAVVNYRLNTSVAAELMLQLRRLLSLLFHRGRRMAMGSGNRDTRMPMRNRKGG